MAKIATKKRNRADSGLRAEWRNVRWQRLRSTPQAPDALTLTERVIAFTAAWALAFAVCDVAIAALMRI